MTIVTSSTTGLTKPVSVLRRFWGSTNRRARLLVGLLLLGLFLMQFTATSVNSIGQAPGMALGKPPVTNRDRDDLERLAGTDHVALLQHGLDNYHRRCADYTCTFTKQERINGILGKEQEIRVRFRESPFSAAMVWVTNPPRGDRMLYVEGRNNNEMLVRPTSLLLQTLIPRGVSRKPDDTEAMKVTLRPVSLFGIERSMKGLLEVYREAKRNGDLQEEFGGYRTFDGQDTVVLIRHLTAQRKGYPAQKTLIYIDVETLYPVMVESFEWGDGAFMYRYTYSDVRFNVGLTEADFAPESIGLRSN